MTETEIQQILIPYLESEGYLTWHPPTKNDQGPDIVGYHPDRHHLWIIESKGDIENSSNRRNAFETALGQICQRGAEQWKQKTKSGSLLPADIITYGLAFPEGEDYRFLCRQIRPGVRPALSLYLFFCNWMFPCRQLLARILRVFSGILDFFAQAQDQQLYGTCDLFVKKTPKGLLREFGVFHSRC